MHNLIYIYTAGLLGNKSSCNGYISVLCKSPEEQTDIGRVQERNNRGDSCERTMKDREKEKWVKS